MSREINNIYSEDLIFEKEFVDLSEQQVNLLFRHSNDVFLSLSGIHDVIVPKPIKQEGYAIKYRLHNLGEPFSNHIASSEIISLIEKSARIIREIHSVKNLLHSDFVLHNLFFNKEKIYVIDSNPPALLGFREDLLYGEQRHDVFSFLHSIIDTRGVKLTLLHPLSYFRLSKVFLKNYGFYFKYKDIFLLFRYLKFVYFYRKKAHKNKALTVFNLLVVYLLILGSLSLRVHS